MCNLKICSRPHLNSVFLIVCGETGAQTVFSLQLYVQLIISNWLTAECSLIFSVSVSLQQHNNKQHQTFAQEGTLVFNENAWSVTKINVRQCPTVEGNGANLMLLSLSCDASPSPPTPPPSVCLSGLTHWLFNELRVFTVARCQRTSISSYHRPTPPTHYPSPSPPLSRCLLLRMGPIDGFTETVISFVPAVKLFQFAAVRFCSSWLLKWNVNKKHR